MYREILRLLETDDRESVLLAVTLWKTMDGGGKLEILNESGTKYYWDNNTLLKSQFPGAARYVYVNGHVPEYTLFYHPATVRTDIYIEDPVRTMLLQPMIYNGYIQSNHQSTGFQYGGWNNPWGNTVDSQSILQEYVDRQEYNVLCGPYMGTSSETGYTSWEG
jgi:hypothetical protein